MDLWGHKPCSQTEALLTSLEADAACLRNWYSGTPYSCTNSHALRPAAVHACARVAPPGTASGPLFSHALQSQLCFPGTPRTNARRRALRGVVARAQSANDEKLLANPYLQLRAMLELGRVQLDGL